MTVSFVFCFIPPRVRTMNTRNEYTRTRTRVELTTLLVHDGKKISSVWLLSKLYFAVVLQYLYWLL